MAQDHHPLFPVVPLVEGHDLFEGFPAPDQGVNAGDEGLITMVPGAPGRFVHPIEVAVGLGQETVQADADENGTFGKVWLGSAVVGFFGH